jgi:chemosensory pili system protein ChpA (sensor histidine kinase/response regulator)
MDLDAPVHAAPDAGDDLSALAWVQEELRRSLDTAHKALRRHLRDAEAIKGSDVDAVDPGVLRAARQAYHQSAGALELVGLPAAASLLRASEAAVQRLALPIHGLTASAVETLERASFALVDFVSRTLAGKAVSPLALFPQYRAVAELAAQDRVHPADLWPQAWSWRDVGADPDARPRPATDDSRMRFEHQLLMTLRGEPRHAYRRMSDLCSELAAGAASSQASHLWRLAAAFFEAKAAGLLQPDVFSKRVGSRLLAQLRAIERGDTAVSERLAHDLLFFCAQSESPGDGRGAPRLAAVRQAYGLAQHRAVPYGSSSLGRFDPAWLSQARKRVAAAKESWSAIASGDVLRSGGLAEQFLLVGDSLRRLYPGGEVLAEALQAAATSAAAQAPSTALAMEVATGLLSLEASLEDGDLDDPRLRERVARLAQRVTSVVAGREAEPLEPWMEELYRRVSDRQTMGSVVQELRASLSEAEKAIDDFFRDPAQRQPLVPVPAKLGAMRGVLSVLGIDAAEQALVHMRAEIDALITADSGDDQEPTFARLASNLGALGFLIDMLSVQPQMAKTLFRYDEQTRTLEPLMGRAPKPAAAPAPVDALLIEQAQALAYSAVRGDVPLEDVSRDLDRLARQAQIADSAGLAQTVSLARSALAEAQRTDGEAPAARERVSEVLADFVNSASTPLDVLEPVPGATPQSPAASAPGEDDDMRAVFLEEAREVIGEVEAAQMQVAYAPHDLSLLTTIRRGFHTLKGSSRMVGLREFGEAAWACEQVYNTRLAEQRPADDALNEFTAFAVGQLSDWIEAIHDGRDTDRSATPVQAAAARLGGPLAPGAAPTLAMPSAPTAPAAVAPPIALVEPVAPEVPPEPELEPAPVDPALLAEAAPLGLPADLPTAGDLDLALPALDPVAADRPPVEAAAMPPDLDFPVLVDQVEPEPAGANAVSLREDESDTDLPIVDLGLPARPVDVDDIVGAAPLGIPAPSAELPVLSLDEAVLPPAEAGSGVPPLESVALPELTEAVLPEPLQQVDRIELDFGPPDAADAAFQPVVPAPGAKAPLEAVVADLEALLEPAPAAPVEPPPIPQAPADGDDVKVIGGLRVPIPLFNIYLNEADELSRRLTTEVAEWAMESHRPVGDTAVALAHSLGGSSATVGFGELSQLARRFESVLAQSNESGYGRPDEGRLFVEVAEEVRRLLHQFAAGFLRTPSPSLMERLTEHERGLAERAQARQLAGERSDGEASGFGVSGAGDLPAPDRPADPVDEALSAHLPEVVEEFQPPPADPVQAVVVLAGPPAASMSSPPPPASFSVDADDLDAVDAVDAELFPVFEEEAGELLPQLASRLREWIRHPHDPMPATACLRTLHTLKGGARLAGAMRLGEMAHRMESRIEHLLTTMPVPQDLLEDLLARSDALMAALDALRDRDAQDYDAASIALERHVAQAAVEPAPVEAITAPPIEAPFIDRPSIEAPSIDAPTGATPEAAASGPAAEGPRPADEAANDSTLPEGDAAPAAEVVPEADAGVGMPALPVLEIPALELQAPAPTPAGFAASELHDLDWSRFLNVRPGATADVPVGDRSATLATSAVRVRTPILERMVGLSGEVSVTRSRIEAGVHQIRSSLSDLTDNLSRMREQLRDIELQAETQMSTRREAARAAAQPFDPLEFDRFTRFQELTRMMAESVNDVGTVHRNLQRAVETAEDELAAQARLTRELQDDLLRTRMVEFESLSERLYRVVRQAAKETGKQVRLDIVGGAIEVDRGVLDRMTPAFEHLLRNAVTHGVEGAADRLAAGKIEAGQILVTLHQEGNDVSIEFRDDGAGLNLPRIRDKGVAMGLLGAQVGYSDAELAQLIFTPGFSTAGSVTELAGRGIGMDIVRAEVNAMGGRIETASAAGQGTAFKLVLPLTTAVTQVVMLRCGDSNVAVPATLVEMVRRAAPDELDRAYATGQYALGEATLPFHWLGALLHQSARSAERGGRSRPLVIIRSAQQRVALHIDEVLGTQEVVVKNLGPQLARLPGLAGMTVLASGAIALIYNPVALATAYGEAAHAATAGAVALDAAAARGPAALSGVPTAAPAPMVLVVDDSLTVRRVTQRLLVREGYRVVLAKDGLEAIERLGEERPTVLLTDIEMPRMDGFDLVRNVRNDVRLRSLPVIMITSRIAQKHRDYAAELGVDHYLGKPYSEDELLALVRRYAHAAPVPVSA